MTDIEFIPRAQPTLQERGELPGEKNGERLRHRALWAMSLHPMANLYEWVDYPDDDKTDR